MQSSPFLSFFHFCLYQLISLSSTSILAYGCPYSDLYDRSKPAAVTVVGSPSPLSSYSVNVSCPDGKLISGSTDSWVESTCNLLPESSTGEWSIGNIKCQSMLSLYYVYHTVLFRVYCTKYTGFYFTVL